MIILEGPDGTGKSNLARRLSDKFELPLHERASTSVGGPVDDLWAWTCRDVGTWLQQPLSIYDRHPLISEPVYGPITRGSTKPGFDHPSARGLMRRLEQYALLVFCLPPLATVRKNVANDGVPQMAGVAGNLDAIYSAYTMRWASWGGWSVIYDYADPASVERVHRAVQLATVTYKRG